MHQEDATPSRRGRKRRDGDDSARVTPASAANGARYDNSLGLLTQKFVDLLKRAPDGILDLNQAADKLGVQKRRIYDITNVLEGIGLIVKKSKNNIQWRGSGSSGSEQANREAAQLRETLVGLQKRESELDQHVKQLQLNLRRLGEDPDSKQFVTHDDIRGLPSLQGKTLIAVKAPSGTTLEVPDPDEGMIPGRRRFQIFLRSSGGPIDVYLVSRMDNQQSEVVAETAADDAEAEAAAAAAAAAAAESDQIAEIAEGVVKVLPPASPDMMFLDDQGIADLYPEDSLLPVDFSS